MTKLEKSKVALVSGGTGAIGGAIAHKLSAQGFNVTIIARDEQKAQKTIQRIKQSTNNEHVTYVMTDLSLFRDIQALAERWEGRLDVLINNAAVTPRSRQETAEGIEMQFATNVLGYFRMTLLFQDILRESSPARIVDVASYWAGGLDLDDLEFNRRRYCNDAAYRQSKQANRMLVAAWAKRLRPKGVCINACHPGDVNSTLSNNLGFGGSQSPEQGAETPVWLAVSPKGGEVTGKYFEQKTERPDPFTQENEPVESLFETCSQYQDIS